ncbi:MAG: hypothetical protein ACE5IL_09365 [Myxococcota bacterium]
MRVVSGAGEFEIRVERLEVRDGAVVMVGKMGIWESETFIEDGDVGQLLRLALRPSLMGWALARPFAVIWKRLTARRRASPRSG